MKEQKVLTDCLSRSKEEVFSLEDGARVNFFSFECVGHSAENSDL